MNNTRVAIALGSNLGDRHAHLAYATARLSEILAPLDISNTHETLPVDVTGSQPLFLNAAAVGETRLSPGELLQALLAIERQRGRERPFPRAARTLDLDVILFGDLVVQEEHLDIPHPRFRERLFVLEPLAEIAPAMRDPVTSMTVAELLARLRQERRAPVP